MTNQPPPPSKLGFMRPLGAFNGPRSPFDSRIGVIALIVCAAIWAYGLVFRPLWRDEYWSLYFADAGQSLGQALGRITLDVHPPGYFLLLRYWQGASQSVFWARAFNVFTVAVCALGCWRLGRARRAETLTFLGLAGTSYWLMFFGVEIRMYILIFCLGAATLIIVRNALEAPDKPLGPAVLMALVGGLDAYAHFFATLWVAVLGGWTVLAFLRQRAFKAAAFWTLATGLALIPAVIWILLHHPQSNPGAEKSFPPFLTSLSYASNQLLRGAVIKTGLENLAATTALIAGGGYLIRRKASFDVVVALAVVSTVVISFVIHFTVVSLIKERAFTVVMPGLIYLMARAVQAALDGETSRGALFTPWIPLLAIVTPLFYMGEYTRNLEHTNDVRKAVARAGDCAGKPVLAYFRPSDQGQDISQMMAGLILKGAAHGQDLQLVDVTGPDAKALIANPPAGCRVRAIALMLPRHEDHWQARIAFQKAGLDVDRLIVEDIGKARQEVYLEPTPPNAPAGN